MRFVYTILCFCCIMFGTKAYAADENLELMRITVPFGWVIAESGQDQVILETQNKEAKFIYKKIPVHYIELEDYARALMKAYGGYNFTKRTSSIYYFEYLHGNKYAWTLVGYYKGNKDILATQTGIGESSDFVAIMASIALK